MCAGEMTQLLRMHSAATEGLSSVRSIHSASQPPVTPCLGDLMLYSADLGDDLG